VRRPGRDKSAPARAPLRWALLPKSRHRVQGRHRGRPAMPWLYDAAKCCTPLSARLARCLRRHAANNLNALGTFVVFDSPGKVERLVAPIRRVGRFKDPATSLEHVDFIRKHEADLPCPAARSQTPAPLFRGLICRRFARRTLVATFVQARRRGGFEPASSPRRRRDSRDNRLFVFADPEKREAALVETSD